MYIRGLRVQHCCYPTRTRSTGSLPVPDPYSKLLPDQYPRVYPYPSLSSLPCIVYVPTMLTCLQLGMSYSLISRLLMIMMTKYFYTNIAKKEETKKGKGGAEEGRGRGRGGLTYEALTTSFSSEGS